MCSWTNWSRNIFHWVEPRQRSKAMQTNIMQTAGNLSRFALTWCHNCRYPRSWILLLSSALFFRLWCLLIQFRLEWSSVTHAHKFWGKWTFFRSVTRYSQTLWRGKVYKTLLTNEITLGSYWRSFSHNHPMWTIEAISFRALHPDHLGTFMVVPWRAKMGNGWWMPIHFPQLV